MGVLPQQLRDMELWEFNACVREFEETSRDESLSKIHQAWQVGYFTGLAFGGKLKKVDTYIKDDISIQAPEVSADEFETKLAAAEGRDHFGT